MWGLGEARQLTGPLHLSAFTSRANSSISSVLHAPRSAAEWNGRCVCWGHGLPAPPGAKRPSETPYSSSLQWPKEFFPSWLQEDSSPPGRGLFGLAQHPYSTANTGWLRLRRQMPRPPASQAGPWASLLLKTGWFCVISSSPYGGEEGPKARWVRAAAGSPVSSWHPTGLAPEITQWEREESWSNLATSHGLLFITSFN